MKISVIIVNFNGKAYADRCVESVFKSKTNDLEVIVVDNNSSDGSVGYLKGKYSAFGGRFKIVELDKNYGPSKARNEGVLLARGKYLAFLDNDTEVHPDWADWAVKEFEENPTLGIIQCKLLLAKERGRIDYAGEYIGSNGFLVGRATGGELDEGQYDQKVEILAAKSAGMLMKKEAFDRIGGFDNDYFIYVEETDLGWRAWLAGYRAIFLPESIIYHESGSSVLVSGRKVNNYNVKFHGTKNYILTLLKNLSIGSLVKILPLHVFLWCSLAWFSLFKGDGRSFLGIHKAILWNVTHLGKTLKKRKKVQQGRIISDKELFKVVMRKKPLRYFIAKATVRCKIGNAESFNRF